MIKLKFHGSLSELRDWLSHHGISGSWHKQPHGIFILRCEDGAILNWSQTKGTVWFSGRPLPMGHLEDHIAFLLARDSIPERDQRQVSGKILLA
jgi:hypothetical protein